MRRSLRNKGRTARSQTTTVKSMSAPIGGWNARDSIANMPIHDAIYLKNLFPTTIDCVLRGGYEAYGTGVTGTVETLAVYNGVDGTNKLFAVSDTDCYDASSSGAASAQTWTDQDDGKYQYINMGDGANNWLLMFNGVDLPKYYNGSSWVEVTGATSPAITGVTTTSLVHATEHHGRLYLLEVDSLSFWYLPANAVGGAATEYDLSGIATKGGYLMWVDTWSFDGGDGPDDYICFMTSQGQAIIYRGTNPSSSATWALVGVFNMVGKPLGRRSHIKYEGDLLALTETGVYPLSQSLKGNATDPSIALTDKINSAFNTAARSYGANFGWEMIIHPLQTALLVNIPISESGGQEQYVMNTITKSWCQFNSWDASCFAIYNGDLYFGGDTVIQKAWTGYSDNGSDIVGEGKAAFNYFGETSQQKRFNLFRPLLQVNGDIEFLTDFDVDFKDSTISGTSSYSISSAGAWGSALWGTGVWSGTLDIVRKWSSPSDNVGYCVSGKIKVNTNALEIHWVAVDYVYEHGGIL